MPRNPYPKRQYPNWAALDPSIDRLIAEGRNIEEIAKDLGVRATTIRKHLSKREGSGTPTAHLRTPEHSGIPQEHPDHFESAHLSTPEPTEILSDEQYTQEYLDTPSDPDHTEVHPGTLEGHQEVMEEVHQSVPDAPHISTEDMDQSIPERLSTPEVHQELSPSHSSMEHFGVPARQDHLVSTPIVHPGTPTADDWELWNTIKSRWLEVEKMLADRQVLLSTPLGTPAHTQKKTYVFDVRHIALIDRYAQDHRLDLKDVIYTMCQEFFERRGYFDERGQQS
jgi:hypothetical protein